MNLRPPFKICLGLVLFCAMAGSGEEARMAVPKHWSFTQLERPALPPVHDKHWPGNPIDSFILAKLEEQKLAPSPEAEKITLLRRLKFDLLGLPPTPEEIKSFLADKKTDAYERLVDQFLASPHYGERWARHWLDVVRFAESDGFEMNNPRDRAWPYRDYVIQSFNADKPYNQFVMEQIAGDKLGADAATSFLVAGSKDRVSSPDVVLTAQQRADELHDMVATTGSAFLGLTVGCARCHNHKFDPISQADYYAMTAVFAGVQHGERELRPPDYQSRTNRAAELRKQLSTLEKKIAALEPHARRTLTGTNEPLRFPVNARKNSERFAPVKARYVRFTISKTTDVEPCLDELQIYSSGKNSTNIALASLGAKASASGTYSNNPSHTLEHINDGAFGNEHSWISDKPGQGWIQIELPEITSIDRIVWQRDRNGQLADRLAITYKIEVAEVSNQWSVVASSEDRLPYSKEKREHMETLLHWTPENTTRHEKLATEKINIIADLNRLTDLPKIYAGQFMQPGPSYRLQRGDPMQPREQVSPGALTQFGPVLAMSTEAPEAERRRALARWLVDEKNPFTARVMVNRIWQHHFGEGLVKTPSDFGVNGARPSHPELLDWLATEFMKSGWSMKHIHRLIVLSSTYRQSSRPNANAAQLDAGDVLLWRFPPQRLEAEPLRDAILAVSGNLDLKMGGPGFDLFEPNSNYVKVYAAKKKFGSAECRRMIYQAKPRMQLDDTFGAFDCPDGGQIAPHRNTSITPLQALNLLNGEFMLEQAEIFSARLKLEAGTEEEAQVKRAFLLAFAREPDAQEKTISEDLIRAHGLVAFCRALFNANEFINVF